ncbi:MAG TPA: hypothetical protein DEA52_02975 [Clostridiaceae bacterium]|nr:hypothetical protein [Clostridiaceae bacterium]
MEMKANERRELLEEKRALAIKSLKRLLNDRDEFFNFINLHDVWYRWMGGRFSVTSIDSMGETLIEYLEKYLKVNNVLAHGDRSSRRILVLDYKGVEFLLRKTDGKEEFGAISIIDGPHSFRVLSWDKFSAFLEKELFIWMEQPSEKMKELSMEEQMIVSE